MSSVGAWRLAIAGALVLAAITCGWPAAVQAATINVTTTSDDAEASDGSVSLREAITAINAGWDLGDPNIAEQTSGTFGTNDAINFKIPGSGVFTINVGSGPSPLGVPLPSLTKPVKINTESPEQVVLDGTGAGAGADGLTLVGNEISVNGLAIVHWAGGAGIRVHSNKDTITGNFIGTIFGTTTAAANANGIVIDAGSGARIGGSTAPERNVISGNAQNGILISNASDSLVEGNLIGTDVSGGSPLFNGGSGIDVTAGSSNNTFVSNTIGASTFPINMNALPNHAVDNSFLAPQTVPSFVTGALNQAKLTLESPVLNGANINIPYTVVNGRGGDALLTMLYQVQCGALSEAQPLVDSMLPLSAAGYGSGTFTLPGPPPGGLLVAGGDGNNAATNLLNPCSVPGFKTLVFPKRLPPSPGPIVPVVSYAHQSRSKWRRGHGLARITRARPPVGTVFSFSLNEQATVNFAFTQQAGGRMVGRKCVAQTKANRRKRACRRSVTRAAMSFAGHQGLNKVSFQGRVSRSKTLGLGTYTLVITATNAAGQHSSAKQLTFTIVR